LAYGGTYVSDIIKTQCFKDVPLYNNFFSKVEFVEDPVILRWDSWRFWESMALGCGTITLDMDKYGFELPVKPENWKHYIGIDLENISRDVERLSTPGLLEEIGRAGREWVLENYSLESVAKRFVEDVTKPNYFESQE
jgi:hypothetical protein